MRISKRTLTRNISSTVLVQLANYVFPMISVPIIVRIIGPDKYGMISFAQAIITYFTLVINYSFNFTATRQVAQYRDNKDALNRIFSTVFGTKLFLFLISTVLFFSCFLVFPIFKDNAKVFLSTYLVCVAWVITPDWFYQGMSELHRAAVFNLITKVVFTGLILIIIHQPDDFYWQPLAFSISQLVVSGVSWRWAMRRYNLTLKLPEIQSIFNTIYEDRMIFFSSVVISLYTSTNIIVLAALASTTEVGYFSAAQKFITIAQAVITIPLSQSIFPLVSQAFGEGEIQGIQTVKRITPYVTLATFAIGIGMLVLGPSIVVFYYGDKFESSKRMFQIMALVPFVISISNLYGIQLMLNLKMDKVFFKIVAAGAAFSLISNAIMTQAFNGIGSSLSWLITECFISLTMGLILFRRDIQIFSWTQFRMVINDLKIFSAKTLRR
ncbi:MAG: flippase [Chryseolinea sp.]